MSKLLERCLETTPFTRVHFDPHIAPASEIREVIQIFIILFFFLWELTNLTTSYRINNDLKGDQLP
jgi:hypothetical protein